MFSSTNPFGQSSTSPFGSQSLFGQTNNASSNPFAPKPFGGTTTFGAQTRGSIFGGTATGVFGASQPSSPLATAPAFNATGPAFGIGSSVPAFGAASTPAFGAASTPAFGSGSTSFGGSSVFGQKPAFGGFGSTASQASPFGSTSQQTQSAFGSNLFGSSTPFGSSSQPTFGATSTPAFGASSTPAFGATSTPAFGSSTTPAFGSTSTGFGGSSMPAFGSGGAFGASSTPAFGASTTAFGSSTPVFGASSTPAFGASTSPSFGASSTPSFSFGSSPAFGQSASAFGSSPFGASSSPFGGQSIPFVTQATTPAFGSTVFGQSAFGAQRGGSRVAAYTPIPEADSGSSAQPAGKLESISAMPVYKDKSHEELRWEDYQLGDKGGPNPAGQPASGIGFGTPAQSNPFGPSPSFAQAQSSSNLFSASSSNPFSSKTSVFGSSGFGTSSTPGFGSSPFGASTTANPFGTTSTSTPSFPTPAFGARSSSSLFGAATSPAFGSSPSIFGSASASGTNSAFGSGLNFGNTQSAGLFQSTTPSLGQTNSAFGQTTSTFGQSTAPSFGQSNLFSSPSTGFSSNLFLSTTASSLSASNPVGFGQTTPSLSTPFQSVQNPQSSSAFSFSNFGQTQAASSGFGGISSSFGQGKFGSQSASYGPMVVQPPPVINPFGTLPAMPQMSIGRAGSAPAVQYGISSMPATEKPAPVRVSSLLTSRHLFQRRIKLPARRYNPKIDGSKVPFFSDDEETPSAPKVDALVIPRENPRALVIHPTEKWPSAGNANKSTMLKDTYTTVNENDKHGDNSSDQEKNHFSNSSQKPNGIHEDHTTQKGDSSITLTGHRTGETATVYEHGAEIEALMPKLRHSDYYTEPRIQELAAKERVEPGFCHHVKDFVVGRFGYGSILFTGETDVRGLDLESLVRFNNREVIVYMDENKKPPVGQGLNKPAEVTLLNIKCFDKKTGQQYTEGAKVDKYKKMLIKKAQEQGAEFVSYDPIKGEWKFRVNHFSCYKLDDAGKVDLDAQPLVLPPC